MPSQKRIYAVLATMMFTVIGLSTNVQQTARSSVASESLSIGYLEYLSPGYEASTKKFPVIIFLHGGGELGNGSPEEPERVASWDPLSHIKKGHNMCFTVDGEQECFLVISPQLMNTVIIGTI